MLKIVAFIGTSALGDIGAERRHDIFASLRVQLFGFWSAVTFCVDVLRGRIAQIVLRGRCVNRIGEGAYALETHAERIVRITVYEVISAPNVGTISLASLLLVLVLRCREVSYALAIQAALWLDRSAYCEQ